MTGLSKVHSVGPAEKFKANFRGPPGPNSVTLQGPKKKKPVLACSVTVDVSADAHTSAASVAIQIDFILSSTSTEKWGVTLRIAGVTELTAKLSPDAGVVERLS